jgi:hypothetical protein
VTFGYEIHPCISPCGPTASPLFKFAPSEFSRQKSPKPFALPRMDAQMPRCHGWPGAADAQPFGFPHVLGQTGEAVNSLYSDRRPLVSCLPCAARLRVSRSWRTIHFFRRSPYRGRFFGERSRRPQMRVNSPGLSPF